jgi:hypothetical protein
MSHIPDTMQIAVKEIALQIPSTIAPKERKKSRKISDFEVRTEPN